MGAQLETIGRSDHQPYNVPDLDDRSRFVRNRVAADPRGAALARADFRAWLETNFALDRDRLSDVVLAVNEAIANAAEFAYWDASQRGTLDISASYDHQTNTLAVAVDDRGRWRQKVPAQYYQQLRGRGIPLMEALADEVAIDRTPHGTRVAMTWTGLAQRP